MRAMVAIARSAESGEKVTLRRFAGASAMQLGIFAKTFARPTLREVFSSVREHGFGCVQFNFACAGRPTLPREIEPELVKGIRSELSRCSLTMAAISGTCNLIHPRIAQRNSDLAKLENLIRQCPELGTSVVTCVFWQS